MVRIDIAGILWRLNKMMFCHLQSPCPENNQVRVAAADKLYITAIRAIRASVKDRPSGKEQA